LSEKIFIRSNGCILSPKAMHMEADDILFGMRNLLS
jgi:hypothetical protein